MSSKSTQSVKPQSDKPMMQAREVHPSFLSHVLPPPSPTVANVVVPVPAVRANGTSNNNAVNSSSSSSQAVAASVAYPTLASIMPPNAFHGVLRTQATIAQPAQAFSISPSEAHPGLLHTFPTSTGSAPKDYAKERAELNEMRSKNKDLMDEKRSLNLAMKELLEANKALTESVYKQRVVNARLMDEQILEAQKVKQKILMLNSESHELQAKLAIEEAKVADLKSQLSSKSIEATNISFEIPAARKRARQAEKD